MLIDKIAAQRYNNICTKTYYCIFLHRILYVNNIINQFIMLMRKFTLLFMSMFLMVGTMVAQDAAFELTSVSPSSDKPVTTAYNIRLNFTKDVVVTLPEGGISVVNNDTQESIIIDRVHTDEWTPKNVVILLFEQVLVADEKGEELRDQYVETPGTYSFTIPAGCIKSVDGEEFAEQTFTFSILSTFGVASFTPTQTDKFEKIDITFEKEIVKVNMPQGGLAIADMYYTNYWYTKEEVVISEDKKTVTLELVNPITESGWYDLMLNQGVFESADGVNAYSTVSINVIDTKPSFSTSYQDGDRVKEISNVLEITFKNVTEVKPAEGENAPKISVYPPAGAEIVGTATCENNKITVTFDGMPTKLESGETEGDFLFVIPAGAFTMDGVANEYREINVTLYTLDIKPLEVDSVTPTESTVNQLDKIVVKFNQLVSLYYDEEGRTLSNAIKLTCGDKEYTLNYAPSGYNVTDNIEYLVNASWNFEKNEWESEPITEPGTYTLNVADIIVNHGAEEYTDQWGWTNYMWHAQNQHCEGTYTWTIGAGEGIKATEAANGEQAIYDLLGRRVEKITGAGIYIVNGKKMVVK